ncbi:MAG: phage major capsid protein [Oscillospiraceae bacterium]|nr:phage major capsid protein [Oscillospiraceae bacterium]MBR3241029.1 phage major capsid protein [Oscillospiraceae bacterium]
MEVKDMTIEELEERKAAIRTEVEAPEADLDVLEQEARAINDEMEARKLAEEKRAEIRSAVALGDGEVIDQIVVEERKIPTMEEIRNSAEYINAYAEYIKTGDATECRALLTENTTNGTVAVPEFVYDTVKTAWEREGITARVRKSYLKGNLKVGFEISGQDAIVHTEGGSAIDPENLVLGVVELVPKSIKKVVQLSDEVMDLRGEAFLRYIYDELTYRIAKKAADTLVAGIIACGTVSTTTCPGVPVIATTTIAVGTIAEAIAQLSDDAAQPVVIMNKQSYAAFKAAQYGAGYAVDPFEGCDVLFNNSLDSFAAASSGDTFAIVGDLGYGALANFPNGDGIDFKVDEMTLKKQDLVEIMGRQFVGIGVVAPDAFVKITKN